MRTAALVVLLGFWGGCAGTRQPAAEAVEIDRAAESKAVYEAVLSHMWLGERVENVVLDPMTSGAAGEHYRLRQEFRGVRADTIRDYQAGADRAQRLPTTLDVGRPIHWVTHEAFLREVKAAEAANDGLPLETAWTRLRQRWRGWSGYLSLGNVGFSADGTQALVDTGAGFAGLSASWHVVFLVKQDGVWKVVDSYESAIA